jgi:hypothetical protein
MLLALASSGCAYRAGCAADGCGIAGELADVRIGAKYVKAGSVVLEKDSRAMSPAFAKALEEVLPAIVEQAVRAALACAGIGAVGAALESCDLAPKGGTP